ncbi:MAG: hypothetical protein KGL35_02755 [Bradyrhizobium sp.]|uniref:hypothetical protein n=1 Tax=Bradyrhizobium sp. TaxID=376 RepID=UPI001C28693C|nr:hypothetical protein [Bradyrhizobium sp.]MBU6461350.1 hypothetical protein [Pseudomonadota bacterium]MDE2066525.1 hypothetical protein [Bradyrhizobium sp.]MDE2467673.1 hypothetical protein [Bradyrhizobium sp.]
MDRGINLPNVIDSTEIERFLLSKIQPQLAQDVHDHVRDSLSKVEPFAAAAVPAPCPTCHAADAPVYNPSMWNNPTVQPHNNCYNYANDHITNTFAQPGRAHGHQTSVMDCAHVKPAAVADGLRAVPNFTGTLGAGAGWYLHL